MAASIQVHASFPHVVVPGTHLNLDANNWHWVHCLTFPIETLNALHFSPRPYKWLRYAIGVVVGAEGHLSSSSNLVDIVDYNAVLQAESATLYYHTSNNEMRRMFPTDPNMGRTNVTSSVATSRGARFCSDVAMRDGNVCVLTGMGEEAEICDAVHLVAHSKGDMYISTYTRRRSRDPSGGDHIDHTDSVRNGLLLNSLTHTALGKHVAFLPTPNFAMTTTDVDPAAPAEEKRFTAHLFKPSQLHFLGPDTTPSGIIPSGTPLHHSDTLDWPPAILFDAVYATSVIHHFGSRALREATATWKHTFDPGGILSQVGAEHMATTDERDATAKERQIRALERQKRREIRSGPDTFDILLALPYILVPPDELQAGFKAAKEKAAAAEQKRIQEKVNSWRSQFDPSWLVGRRFVQDLSYQMVREVNRVKRRVQDSEGHGYIPKVGVGTLRGITRAFHWVVQLSPP